MQSSTLVSVDEYLATSYRPDCDYVDGEIRERNVGEYDHARLQALLTALFLKNEKQWGVRVVVEQRVQVRNERFRVPDICLLSLTRTPTQIIVSPPFLCVEILSPDDTLYSMQERIDDYLAFGVPYVWVINPASRRAWIYTKDAIQEAKDGVLRASNPDIEVPIVELFDPIAQG